MIGGAEGARCLYEKIPFDDLCSFPNVARSFHPTRDREADYERKQSPLYTNDGDRCQRHNKHRDR